MHHLILVRESAQGILETECCGVPGSAGCRAPRGCEALLRRERAARVAAVYWAVKEAFADRVRISMLDPRNLFAYLPLVMLDTVRYRVPLWDALRSATAPSVATGIFDGQILFKGTVPTPQEVVERIQGRLRVHRVGAEPDA